MTREESQRLAARILKFSKFPECAVSINTSEEAYVRFANNGITTSGFTRDRTIVISSTREQKTGTITTTADDDDALRSAVGRSEQLAGIAPANAEHVPQLGVQEYPAPADYDEETARARAPVMIPHIRAVIDGASARKLVAAGFFGRRLETAAIANNKGLFGYHRSTDARMSATVRAADGSSSGWDGQPAVRIHEINGPAIASRAINKCIEWRNPRRLDPGRYTVVLEPTATSDLVRLVAFAFQARAAEEGRSFLSKKGGGTKLGEKIFPEFITLSSDPLSGRLPGLPWSASSLANRPMTWIDKGVIRNLAYDRYWAAKTGKEPTPAPSALVLQGGDGSTEDLVRGVERGLLVTHFWYIRFVNQQTLQHTGLTRNGLFLIENGRIAAPAVNMRFTDSPVRLLESTRRLGRAIRVQGLEGGSMIAPALVSDGFTFTSVSEAV